MTISMRISPQAWGCTAVDISAPSVRVNLPTGVGMYRLSHVAVPFQFQSPHRRGDVPETNHVEIDRKRISPQAWGCTAGYDAFIEWAENLPTGVGMYRGLTQPQAQPGKSPHRRGDVPIDGREKLSARQISPQAWGCTGSLTGIWEAATNLPTGVGMYRYGSVAPSQCEKSPHRRGDVPATPSRAPKLKQISPQAWGCTVLSGVIVAGRSNLPTGVGMYRKGLPCGNAKSQSPHRRGDVPTFVPDLPGSLPISPQAWGCTDCQADIDR